MIRVSPRTAGISIIPASDFIVNLVLSANVEKRLYRNQFPSDSTFALFSHAHPGSPASKEADLMVRVNGVASIPIADVLDGTGCHISFYETFIDIRGANFISMICPENALVAIAFYKEI